MASLLVVVLVLVAILYLCLRQPRRARARGCCAGAWPPDDLSGNDRRTGSDTVEVDRGSGVSAADGA